MKVMTHKKLKNKTYIVTFGQKIKGFKFSIGTKVKCINSPPWSTVVLGETYRVLDLSPEWKIKIKIGTWVEWVHQSHFEELVR